jgi:hypothetical protein
MEYYVGVSANVQVIVKDKYLKASQFTNVHIIGLDPALSPEGVLKYVILDYFKNFKQSKNTDAQIKEIVHKALEIHIATPIQGHGEETTKTSIQLGKMKYNFRTRRTMPLPGQDKLGIEAELEIVNTETNYSVSSSEMIHSFDEFVKKYLNGIIVTEDVEDIDQINKYLKYYNLILKSMSPGIYKVVHKK